MNPVDGPPCLLVAILFTSQHFPLFRGRYVIMGNREGRAMGWTLDAFLYPSIALSDVTHQKQAPFPRAWTRDELSSKGFVAVPNNVFVHLNHEKMRK